MKRIIDSFLRRWSQNPKRKPLLIRGARQVGKTYAVRVLGQAFEHFLEINFEQNPKFADVFSSDLDPKRIIPSLEILTGKPIIAGKSLVFFDEVQLAPKAMTAMRYFYEKNPDIHLIASGSLLEFHLESIGIPVGRIQHLFMYPVSFLEYLRACGEELSIQFLLELAEPYVIPDPIHEKLMRLWSEYMAIGGMPESVQSWCENRSFEDVKTIHRSIMETFRQDFEKYSKGNRIGYISLLFERIPWLQGRKFKYSHISDSLKKRELSPSLELLIKAGISHVVTHSAGQGVPLGAQANPDRFKVLFIDIGLGQAMLGPGQGEWMINPANACINKGNIVEAYVGQELIVYSDPDMRANIHYWHREERSANAEVDYLTVRNEVVIPIEVKSGTTGSLKSLHLFLNEHSGSPFGIRFHAGSIDISSKVRSYPLYCTPKLFLSPERIADFQNQ